MIVARTGRIEGTAPADFAYSHELGLVSRIVLRVTRRLRARYAAGGITDDRGPLLDVGCGDGYFIRFAGLEECRGFDSALGDEWCDLDRFADGYFSYVTMLAVIEHLAVPEVVRERLWRVLRPGGRLIMTTPTRKASGWIRLYAPRTLEEHKVYYDLASMNGLLDGKYSLVDYRRFLFGMNQVFSYQRLP